MTDFHELLPIPSRHDINTGCSPARPSTMLERFGRPGRLTVDCSPVTSRILHAELVTSSVGPFTVTGWGPAVRSLKAVFAEIRAAHPDLYAVIGTAGMLCCRAVRGSTHSYSNHSWGCAIDLTIGGRIDLMRATHVQRGILMAYPYFHAHGWFWAAGYERRKDPMHFELCDEAVRYHFKVTR